MLALVLILPLSCAQSGEPGNPLGRLSEAIRQLTNRVAPTVVEILVTSYGTRDTPKGQVSNPISMQRSSGSGIIVDPSGYIVTSAHVVEGAISIKVLLPNADGLVKEARVLGLDEDSDMALIRIDGIGFPAIEFADSDGVRQGDLVFAIGSPIGLRNSLSMGVVSATARSVNDENPILYIQTDASINPGNSGGALVNTDGCLVGLNAYIVTQSGGNEGIGFAIPSNAVRNVYRQLREKGRVSRGMVGIYVQNIDAAIAEGLNLPVASGIVVSDLLPEGPAEKAGLKRGDVVASVNGEPMKNAQEFDSTIYRRSPGSVLTFRVLRGASQLDATVKVEESPGSSEQLDAAVSENNLVARLGVLCVQIDKKIADANPDLRRGYGLIVAGKSTMGQSQFIDLREMDIIHRMNGGMVTDLGLFRKAIDALPTGTAVVLQIERDHRMQFIGFHIQ